MKVVDNRKAVKGFDQLKVGDTFEIDGHVFMRVNSFQDECYEETYNSVCLNDGTFYFACDHDDFQAINATIVIGG